MATSEDILEIFTQRQGYIYTSIPAKVVTYNGSNQTCDVEILIKRPFPLKSAERSVKVRKVPVGFYYGDDWVIAAPLAPGDAVLLVCPMFDIGNWLTGDKEKVYEADGYRFHNLEGSFALPVAFTYNSPTRDSRFTDKFHIVQGDNYLTMDSSGININAGSTSIVIDKDGAVTINPTSCTINSDLQVNGSITATGNIQTTGGASLTSSGDITASGEMTVNGLPLSTHVHAENDGGDTGPPKSV